MDMLILGLLMLKDVTVYEIQTFLRQGMYLMYSDSMGSIQAAIKKLLKEKDVVFTERVDNGKNKKIYSITNEGKEKFTYWLSQPVQSGITQSRMLTKLFFTGMLSLDEKKKLMKSYIAVLQEKLDTLEKSQQAMKSVLVKNEMKDVAIFQLATIEYSINSIQFEMNWYSSLLEKIITRSIYYDNFS